MTQTPLVSVLTSTHNRRTYLEQCIRSVEAQSHGRWEMIVMDDGSNDGTRELLEGWDDARVRHYHQSNQGPFGLARTFNTALSHAKGDLVALLDDDDYWPADKLEHQVPAFADDAVVMSWGRDVWVDSQSRPMHGGHNSYAIFGLARARQAFSADWQEMARAFVGRGGTLILPSTVVIRRSSLEAVGGFRQPEYFRWMDPPTLWRLVLFARGRYHFTPSVAAYYRRHPSQGTSTPQGGAGRRTYARLVADVWKESGDVLARECGVTEAQVNRLGDRLEAMALLEEGTYQLGQRDWPGAAKAFAKARHPDLPIERKIWGLVGRLSVAVRHDLVRPSMRARALLHTVVSRAVGHRV